MGAERGSMSALIRPFLFSAVLLFMPLAYAQDAPAQKPDGSAKPAAVAEAGADADYKIGPQDIVRIDVWKEPDISRTIPVRPDGKISLPLLNDVQASGLTAMQLSASLRESLAKYLTSPQVTVTVTEINSRRVYITGEVNACGCPASSPEHDRPTGTLECGRLYAIRQAEEYLRSSKRGRQAGEASVQLQGSR